MQNNYKHTFTSYSGCDMVASIKLPWMSKAKVIGSLQTVSYSTHREVLPVRTLGRINPKGYARGQRTIAGSLIFTVFDKNIVWDLVEELNSKCLTKDKVFLMDDLPPFDITIVMTNEYGQSSGLRIKGVIITDEGQVMSIEDLLTENTYSFIAHDLVPLRVL